MSINPNLIPTGGFDPRVASILADVQRQLGQAMANINSIPAGGVSGGPGGQIKATSITSSEIAAGAIVAGTIAAGAVTAGTIAAGAINSNTLFVSGVIQASSIQSNTITATQIAAHTITSTELTSTAIDGMTITGSTIKTSAGAGSTGAGVVITTLGVAGWDATPTRQFFLDSTTGLIQAKGVILAQAGSALPVSTITGYLPAGANRYSNSAFQNGANTFDTAGWTVSAAAAASGGTTVPVVYGALTMQLTATGATVAVNNSTIVDPYRRVLPGISYTASHYVYPTSVARNAQADIAWYNSAGTFISTSAGAATATTLNQWTRISTTATAPATAAYALPVHYIGLSAAVGNVFYTECFQLEEGDRASAWSPRPDEILVNQINAVNINVANLSAISANLGTITAGTITGALIQTAGSASARVQMSGSANRFEVYDSGPTLRALLDGTNGLQLTAGTSGINAIEWFPTVGTGTPVSVVYGSGTSGNSTLTMLSEDSAGHPVLFQALRNTGTDANNIAQVAVSNAAGSVTWFATILDGTTAYPRSNFLQVSAGSVAVPSATWFGAVTGATGAARLGGVGTWTVTRTAVGTYTLVVKNGISGVWAIPIVQCNESNGAVARVDYVSLGTGGTAGWTTFNVFTASGPFSFGLADINWSFHAFASAN